MTATGDLGDGLLDYTALPMATARSLLRLIEEMPEVCRRHQFYLMLQSHLQDLLPHTVAICGLYDRQLKALAFDVFNTMPLSPKVLQELRRAETPLLRQAAAAWVSAGGVPTETLLGIHRAIDAEEAVSALLGAGVQRLLVHGVSRPERPHEVSSLFLLGGPVTACGAADRRLMQLVVHAMHAAYVRVMEVEREVGAAMQPVVQRFEPPALPVARVTPREIQILSWIREGKNNQEIGVELGISALTVKNHIQKILRKLRASNRAHAVARAMELQLLADARLR